MPEDLPVAESIRQIDKKDIPKEIPGKKKK